MCPGVGSEGWLRCFAHPSGGFEYRGHLQYPAFDLNSLFFKECFIYFWQCWVFFVASYRLSLVAVSWGGLLSS